jgi:hypothetical protein
MKKIILIISVFILIENVGYSQHVENLKKFNLQFESPSNLTRYNNFFEFRVFGWNNDDYEVDIDATRNNKKNSEYYSDIKNKIKPIAKLLNIVNIEDGEYLKNVNNGYYVIGERKDPVNDNLRPVVFLIILDNKGKFAFEITIDCYTGNLDVGKEIANSFLFTK